MEIRHGKILEFRGSWMSGLAYLVIEDTDFGVVSVPCDNGTTVRSLEAAFGNTIGDGHTVEQNGGFVGQYIYYSMDEFGLVMAAFTPESEASLELVEAYQLAHDRRQNGTPGE
jgi:hypothetical protein